MLRMSQPRVTSARDSNTRPNSAYLQRFKTLRSLRETLDKPAEINKQIKDKPNMTNLDRGFVLKSTVNWSVMLGKNKKSRICNKTKRIDTQSDRPFSNGMFQKTGLQHQNIDFSVLSHTKKLPFSRRAAEYPKNNLFTVDFKRIRRTICYSESTEQMNQIKIEADQNKTIELNSIGLMKRSSTIMINEIANQTTPHLLAHRASFLNAKKTLIKEKHPSLQYSTKIIPIFKTFQVSALKTEKTLENTLCKWTTDLTNEDSADLLDYISYS